MSKADNDYSLTEIVDVFKKSRQAYYKGLKNDITRMATEQEMIKVAKDVKAQYPGIGTEKLRLVIQVIFKDRNVYGRDKFHKLMRQHNLINKPRKTRTTTNSKHRFRKYSFIAEGITPTHVNQLWVSDITYIQMGQDYCYLHLIMDVYSRKVLGYTVSPTLHVEYTLQALHQALKTVEGDSDLTKLIHHSDRGTQYCSNEYTNCLKSKGIQISMTQSGNPLDNAFAERLNGILKGEAIDLKGPYTHMEQVKKVTKSAVHFYNEVRPHRSLKMKTPSYVYENDIRTFKNTNQITS